MVVSSLTEVIEVLVVVDTGRLVIVVVVIVAGSSVVVS